jgi:uncharacterized protein YbjT (DUF2867 family)
MSGSDAAPPRLLLVGGSGGLVGRSVLPAFAPSWRIRSVHRTSSAPESQTGVDWVPGDVQTIRDWGSRLEGSDCVLNLAWYRWASPKSFRRLADGLVSLIDAARRRDIPRFLQVSVPAAPESLETGLPYLVEKRRVDRALTESGLSYRIVRPTLLFGPGDVLLGVMLRMMRRYGRFPMFEAGAYHVSPFATRDLAEVLALEARGRGIGTIDLGGPQRLEYRELTDQMFASLGQRPRYLRLHRAGALRLAALMVAFRSTMIYPYEIEWLLSDRLGLPAYGGLDRPLTPVRPYLEAEVARLRGTGSRTG